MNSNRREFIVRSSLAVAAGALGSGRLFAQQPAPPRRSRRPFRCSRRCAATSARSRRAAGRWAGWSGPTPWS